MLDIFVYCYAAVSSVTILTGLYFTFTDGGKKDE